VLNLVEGALEHPRLELLLVVNTARPLTSTVDGIEDEARRFTRITGLVNNTHLGEETEMQLVQRGAERVSLAARRLDLPVVATCALQSLAAEMGPEDIMGNPVWPLKRYLHTAFW
jgi:hypothetical protein